MSSITCDASATLSHDELMLKELERRDGIYSFIFHELEAPKASPPLSPNLKLAATASRAFSEPHHNPKLQLSSANAAACASAAISTVLSTTSVVTTAITPTTAAAAAATCTFPQHYHEFMKAWHPPPALVYNHPRLYAYMANCGFRVRVPTPRFSHLSAPLVRNRRHVLKDAPDYKSSSADAAAELCFVQIPDLRALFPYDPDVHAPFAVGGSDGSCKGVISIAAINSPICDSISKH